LNSGTGWFGYIDPEAGAFAPLAFCPGYARGLAFAGDYAVVGLSRPRRDNTFGGLELEVELKHRNTGALCGLLVIDLRTGDVAHWLGLTGMVTELYDVVVLPGVVRPSLLGFLSWEARRTISIGDWGAL
jgi:uncharacterized protein (TIGR03032 family)